MYFSSHCASGTSPYQAVQINVKETGYYTLIGTGDFPMSSYLYKNSFDPNNPIFEEHMTKDVYCNDNGFRQNTQLLSTITYILVIAADRTDDKGSFSIIVYGSTHVRFKVLSECIVIFLLIFL